MRCSGKFWANKAHQLGQFTALLFCVFAIAHCHAKNQRRKFPVMGGVMCKKEMDR